MKDPRYILFVLILSLKITVFGQEVMQNNKEIGISFFTVENNGVTLNPGLEPKFVFGAYFNKYFSNWSWISHLEYGYNIIEDDCKNCMDNYFGEGELKEFAISTGLRYTFLKQRSFFVNPFIKSDLSYSNIIYKGDFDGRFSGDGIKIEDSYNTFGILARTGLVFNLFSRISFSLSSSVRFGAGTKKDNYQNSVEKINLTALTVMHIRLGFQF